MWATVHEGDASTPDTWSEEQERIRAHIRKVLKRLPRAKGASDKAATDEGS